MVQNTVDSVEDNKKGSFTAFIVFLLLKRDENYEKT